MQRLCGSSAKTLFLLHVTPEDNVEIAFPFCLDIYHVEAVEVERWIPKKHREDVGLEEKALTACEQKLVETTTNTKCFKGGCGMRERFDVNLCYSNGR
ncbi:unnamed protein product [Calypogeia fissa]